VLGGPSAKFGVPLDSIVDAYRAAKAAGAMRFGLHMMTGSCVMSDAYWKETVGVLAGCVQRLQAQAGIAHFDFINIGGGLGIPYQPHTAPVDLESLSAQLAETLQERWLQAGVETALPRLFMENGRFMTGPFGWLVARCEAEKHAWGARYIGLDACMAHLMRPGMYEAYHHITVPGRDAEALPQSAVHVVGTLCENNDWFAKVRGG